MPKLLGSDAHDDCLGGDFMKHSRWVRNSLTHSGGLITKDLEPDDEPKRNAICKYLTDILHVEVFEDTIPGGPAANEKLIRELARRVDRFAELAVVRPEFQKPATSNGI